MRVIIIALLFSLCFAALAWASPYDDLSVEEIRAQPDFVADNYSLSSATNSGESDAVWVYQWIGYIPVNDTRVYFTSFGEALTCVQWEATGEWVPLWVVDALDRLLAEGYIVIP
jgi:hypothetical protein